MIRLLYLLKFDKFIELIQLLHLRIKIYRYEQISNQKINFVSQGSYNLSILGNQTKFTIDITSHLKSDTTIECSGGIRIGRYFHCGKGLTIFSSNHDYNSHESIPYGKKSISKPVIIEDFVWVGANVTIVPVFSNPPKNHLTPEVLMDVM